MSQTDAPALPFLESVLHPSDLSETAELAFAHALALALVGRSRLTIFHVTEDFEEGVAWTRYPAVRRTLERWGLLEEGSSRRDVVDRLGMDVAKVRAKGSEPAEAVLRFAREEAPDLIVLATEARRGLPRWLHPSRAERIARHSRAKTLFVPAGVRGFVAPQDGALHLRRIVVPVDHEPDATAALRCAVELAEALGDPPVELTCLHVGEKEGPALELPEGGAWRWRRATRSGDVVDEILEEARDRDADLLVAATAGHQDLFDAVRGSVTERLVREAPCPVLAVPQD